jgi:N-ethylmaleimide reductase
VIVNFGLTQESAAQFIEAKEADLVAFGSRYIANPDLVERFQNNWTLSTPDRDTFYTPGAKGYSAYRAYA